MFIVAVKGFAVRDRKLLLIRRADDQIYPGTWEPVGGKVELGENLPDALRREFREETGLNVEVGALLYASTFLSSSERQVVILAYDCGVTEGDVRLSPEHVDRRWVGEAEARLLLPAHILSDMEMHRVFEVLGLSD